ncbi:MAG: hypothetical protein JSW33_11635 [bacterium]|nr:MAG: hypothetical protein JSW33_11635 [bacterium]
MLTKIHSRGNQRGLFGILPPSQKVEPSYENIFEAIPYSKSFRPSRAALHPKIYGVMNAKIDSDGEGDQAKVDEKGRYKVILPFDLSGNKDGTASHYIRMIQPYAGADYGVHFPLHKGTEVLLTFIDGNPDRPVISGAVPNFETVSPVTDANQLKSVIRDDYGNEIVLDTTRDDQHIRLHSPHHNSTVEIGRSIVTSTDGDWFSWEAGNSVELSAGNKFEGFAGNTAEAKIGMALDVLLGLGFQFEGAGKHSFLLGYDAGLHIGPEFKYHIGPTIEKSNNDKTSIAAGDNILSAKKVLSLVGGARSDPGDTSIINLKDDGIEFTIGSNKNPDSTAAQKWVKGLLVATPIATTIIASVFAALMTPALAVPDDEEALRYGLAGTAGIIENLLILANVITVTLLGNLGLKDSINPVSHFDEDRDEIRTIIKMEKGGGITAGTLPQGRGNNLNEMDNKLEVSVANGVTINSKTKQIMLGSGNKGEEQSIIQLDNNGISIIGGKGKSEIELDGNGNVKIFAEGNIEFAKCGEIKFHNFAKLDKGALNFTGTKKIKSSCFEAGLKIILASF